MPDHRPRWHPFLGTEEREPGTWTLIDSLGVEYGLVRIIRVQGEVGYRAEFRGHLVGHYLTLRTALERTHQVFVKSGQPESPKNLGYLLPDTTKEAPSAHPRG